MAPDAIAPAGEAMSAWRGHVSSVQAALDRARRAGDTPAPPRWWRASPVTLAPRGSEPTSFDRLFRAAAQREGLDPALLRAVARAESNLDPDAVSPAGAKGLMQLADATAWSLGVDDVFDPAQNIAAGAEYLGQMLRRYGGDTRRALAAYNAGPATVDRYGGVPPYAETQTYIQRVLGLLNQSRP
jgi:soluble lytic murein transglycosylase-like protein